MRALEPLNFMATSTCPKWLFHHNSSNVCRNLLIRRAQQVPANFMPHLPQQCRTPYCQVLVRLVDRLEQFEDAVQADVINWTDCESLLVDCLVDSRKLFFIIKRT